MSFYGAPKPAPPVLPPYGSKLPHTRRHSTKLYFKTHDEAVAFCKQQKRHLNITVVSKIVEDSIVKQFMVDFK